MLARLIECTGWLPTRKSDVQGLHVKFVWPDENCSSREFCLWAGRVLKDKVIKHELAECKFSFNLLVHSDDQAPAASFLPSSSTVQVSTAALAATTV